MKSDTISLDLDDYPDPREYNDPNETMVDQEELDRQKLIEILEEELSENS